MFEAGVSFDPNAVFAWFALALAIGIPIGLGFGILRVQQQLRKLVTE